MDINFTQMMKKIGKTLFLIIGILWIISPVDLLPEMFLGPVGLIDDIIILVLISIVGLDIGQIADLKNLLG